MGTDTIPARTAGQIIAPSHPNLLRDVLALDHVPRNASGVAADIAGNLGTSTYRWNNLFAKLLNIGAIASGLTIEDDSGDIVIKVGAAEVCRISADGLDAAGLEDSTLTIAKAAIKTVSASPGLNGFAVSASCGAFSTYSVSFVDVTNLSVTLTTKGNPVELGLTSDGGGNNSQFSITHSSASSAAAYLRFLQDASEVGQYYMSTAHWGSTTSSAACPASCINHKYVPAAGTYTWKVQLRSLNSSVSSGLAFAKLYAREIF